MFHTHHYNLSHKRCICNQNFSIIALSKDMYFLLWELCFICNAHFCQKGQQNCKQWEVHVVLLLCLPTTSPCELIAPPSLQPLQLVQQKHREERTTLGWTSLIQQHWAPGRHIILLCVFTERHFNLGNMLRETTDKLHVYHMNISKIIYKMNYFSILNKTVRNFWQCLKIIFT